LPFSQIREGRTGAQLELSFRVFRFVLSGWCQYQQASYLRAVDFDKLSLFVARIWDKMFRRTGGQSARDDPDNIPAEVEAKLVRFPFPFSVARGIHGPGLCLFDPNTGPIYLTELLYQLQELRINHYLYVEPPGGTGNPRSIKTRVSPGGAHPPDEFLRHFTPTERKLMDDLNNALKRFSDSEIYVLGTHYSCQATIDDVKFEFNKLKESYSIVIESIKQGSSFLEHSCRIDEFSQEACRKSCENKTKYTDVYNRMLREMGHDPELADIFASCQAHPDQLWDPQRMQPLVECSYKTEALSCYLHCISYCQDYVAAKGLRLDKHLIALMSSGRLPFQKFKRKALPDYRLISPMSSFRLATKLGPQQ
jgi:hypothetical protein